jgi:hypothetical protein
VDGAFSEMTAVYGAPKNEDRANFLTCEQKAGQ